jgi:hypothetical protein
MARKRTRVEDKWRAEGLKRRTNSGEMERREMRGRVMRGGDYRGGEMGSTKSERRKN